MILLSYLLFYITCALELVVNSDGIVYLTTGGNRCAEDRCVGGGLLGFVYPSGGCPALAKKEARLGGTGTNQDSRNSVDSCHLVLPQSVTKYPGSGLRSYCDCYTACLDGLIQESKN